MASAERETMTPPYAAARSAADWYVSPKQIALRAEVAQRSRARAVAPRVLERWIALRTDAARRAGRLLTDAQHDDLAAGRRLAIGDRARYVGPTRLEQVGAGTYARPHGQLGLITQATCGADGGFVFVFTPELDPKIRDAALRDEIDVALQQLRVTELHGYWLLERVS